MVLRQHRKNHWRQSGGEVIPPSSRCDPPDEQQCGPQKTRAAIRVEQKREELAGAEYTLDDAEVVEEQGSKKEFSRVGEYALESGEPVELMLCQDVRRELDVKKRFCGGEGGE